MRDDNDRIELHIINHNADYYNAVVPSLMTKLRHKILIPREAILFRVT